MPQKKYPYYPIYVDVEDHDVLIVGGGEVCARKAETMLRYGARVTVVAPKATAEITEWAEAGKITLQRKEYEESDLDGRSIVIASTNDSRVNTRVATDCRRRKILVNVVDVTDLCEFIVPAILERGSIQIAISTAGKSPALARTLKEDLRRMVGGEYAEANEILGSLRDAAKKRLPTDVDRKHFFDGILEKDLIGLLREGRRDEAQRLLRESCEAAGVEVSPAIEALATESAASPAK